MHLTEHLNASGVSLSREVGVIIEETNESGQTKVTCARIARVCVNLPEGVHDHEDAQDFDPEYDIAVIWGTSKKQVCLLRMTDDAVLYQVDQGGLIIESDEARIIIGQTDTFMDSVCQLMCTLAQPT
jgi:hypothetical protein